MKNKTATSLAALFALSVSFPLIGDSYTATLPSGAGDIAWDTSSIWSGGSAPSAAGDVVINGADGTRLVIDGYTGAEAALPSLKYNMRDGASLYIKDSDLPLNWAGNSTVELTDSTLATENSNWAFPGSQNGANSATVKVQGNSVLSVTGGTFVTGSFFRIWALNTTDGGQELANTSTLTFKDVTVAGSFIALRAEGAAVVNFDNATWDKQMWDPVAFSDTSKLNISNGGLVRIGSVWGGAPDTAVSFSGSSQMSIAGAASKFATNAKVHIRDNAVVNVTDGGEFSIEAGGAGSTLSGNSQINVDGGTVSAATLGRLEISGADAAVNFKNSALTWGGTLASNSLGFINFGENTTLSKSGTITLASSTRLRFNSGSVFNAGAGKSLIISEDSSVTFNGGELRQADWPAIEANGNGELNFKNGSTYVGNYGQFLFSGNAKLNVDGESTVWRYTPPNDSTFSGNSQINVTNGATLGSNGNFGADARYYLLTEGASMNVSAATVSFKSTQQTLSLADNASLNVSGNSSKSGLAEFVHVSVSSLNAGDTATVALNGNATLNVTNTVTLGDSSGAGSQQILLSGADNSFSALNLNMAGDSLFRVAGSSNSVAISGALNASGGTLSLVADASGFAALDIASIAAFDIVLEMDFSGYAVSGDVQLIANSSYDFSAFVADETKWNHTDARGNTYGLFADASGLWVTYAAVPEPGSYAAIFGALALAFAVRRRRR